MQFNILTNTIINNSIQNTDSNDNNVDCRTGVISSKRTTSNAGDDRDRGDGGGEDPCGRVSDQRVEVGNDQSGRRVGSC